MSKEKTPIKSKPKAPAKPKTESKKAADAKPKAKPAAKPKTKTAPKLASKPAAKPASKPAAKAPAKSTTKPASTSKSTTAVKSAANSASAAKTENASKPKTSRAKVFTVDQRVVYPSQGVGLIKEIVQKKFKDAKIPYYIIYIEVTDMTIMVPVDRAVELGIRPTVSRDEANKALELIKEDFDPIPSDWKMRYQMNLDLLKKGSIRDIASIVRSLYHRQKVKELPIMERKLYDSALKLFIDEISISLRKSKEDVESMLFSRLEAE